MGNVLTTEITPVIQYGQWWAKRDDFAYHDGIGACGSKVRQYMQMVAEAPPDAVFIVGCSSVSAQQVYIADAVRRTGRPGYVVVPKRKEPTMATRWAINQGCHIVDVPPPAYRSVCVAKMRQVAKELGCPVVRWLPDYAVEDTAEQVRDIPRGTKRIVVPTGSGLVAAGVLAGLARVGLTIPVVAVAVSSMAKPDRIQADAQKLVPHHTLPSLQFLVTTAKYEKPAVGELPDGTVLDPYYAAKALDYVQPGDLFWVTGCRPLAAMPT